MLCAGSRLRLLSGSGTAGSARAVRRCGLWCTMTADAVASSGGLEPANTTGDQAPAKLPKRSVALHVGYVGTGYTGLQANRELPGLATVEGVLERAILDAGLISEANFGDFRKSKWTRSSRTDKGVHSLGTVIGLRVLVGDEAYESDPEGVGFARQISAHLPRDVRVFAVQRTNKSFNARRWCGQRTYEYYLPAALLGLDEPDGSSAADVARLALLRDVLGAFVGAMPYHNYAGNRKQYVHQKEKATKRKERRAARVAAEMVAEGDGAEAAAGAAVTTTTNTNNDDKDEAAAANAVMDGAPSAAVRAQRKQAARRVVLDEDDETDDDEDTEMAEQGAAAAAQRGGYSGEGPVPPELQWRQQVRFLQEPDPDDPVVKSHYRNIRSFTADDPRPLVPGGVPCVRLEVCGDSFMLHQIRHMVGAAVAVVRGIMPRELIEVSLSAPGRVALPRAPPHTLLLAGTLFSPFPTGWGETTPIVSRYSGERLQLREQGTAELASFRAEVFDAALNALLQHGDWEFWSRCVLPRYVYDGVAPAVAAHSEWYTTLLAKRVAAREAAAARAARSAASDDDQGKAD